MKLSSTAILVLSLTMGHAAPRTFTNPVHEHGPDPWIIYYRGSYYYMCTTNVNLTIWKASTMDGLKKSGGTVVWQPAGAYSSLKDMWAPELHRINHKWYIYFAADKDGENKTHRLYVLESPSDDPLLPTWSMKGRITDASDRWAIDATILKNNHKLYMIWSGWPGDQDGVQNIYIARLKNAWTVKGNRVLISTPEFDWERGNDINNEDTKPHVLVNEAPEVLMNRHKIFLVYSAGGCWNDGYELGMLTGSANQDPMVPSSWHKSRQPVFHGSSAAHAYGTGHNAFFKSPDDKQDWIIYHANYGPNEGCKDDRSSRAQPFGWNSDGTPTFGVPLPYGQPVPEPSGEHAPN